MKLELLKRDYIQIHQQAANQYEAIHIAAQPLLEDGKVRNTFIDAVCTREIESPTGLDSVIGVAIPHTDAFHVIEEAVAVVTLDEPVVFHLMGDPSRCVDVSVIFLLAIKNGTRQVETLQTVVNTIRDQKRMQKILDAKDAQTVYNLINNL